LKINLILKNQNSIDYIYRTGIKTMSTLRKERYLKSLEAEIQIALCESCKQNKVCLCTDPSNDDYGSVNLCFNCIQELFNEYETSNIKETGYN
jgi:hypothetical protein